MRRSQQTDPDSIRLQLIELLEALEFKEAPAGVSKEDLRCKVLTLVPAHHLLRDMGSSLISQDIADVCSGTNTSYT